MIVEEISRQLVQALADMREEEPVSVTRETLAGACDPIVILAHCREAMEIVGKRYEESKYFLPELTLTGEMLRATGDIAKPLIKQGASPARTPAPLSVVSLQFISQSLRETPGLDTPPQDDRGPANHPPREPRAPPSATAASSTLEPTINCSTSLAPS